MCHPGNVATCVCMSVVCMYILYVPRYLASHSVDRVTYRGHDYDTGTVHGIVDIQCTYLHVEEIVYV